MPNKVDYSDAPEWVQRFLAYKTGIQNRSTLTANNYYYDLRTFARYLLVKKDPKKYESIAFSEISFSAADNALFASATAQDIYEYTSFVKEELNNQSTASRLRKLSCLRSFYKYLTKTIMKLEHNPAENIESPKKEQRLPKYLSLEESKELLSGVDGKYAERDFAIITLFLNCGLRVSELVGIDLTDITKDMTSLTVIGKGNKQRRIFLNDACRDALRSYLKVRPTDVKMPDNKALFISRNRNRISVKTVQWLIYKHLENAGLARPGMSVHKLRHTAATLMYNYGGTDVRVLKDILGHENLSTTEIYTHIDSNKLVEAANNNPLSSGVKRVGRSQDTTEPTEKDEKEPQNDT